MILHAGPVGHPVGSAQPGHAVPRGNIPAHRWPGVPGLPPGHRVVALREVREDAIHTNSSHYRAAELRDHWSVQVFW